jgi:hypothetical protein
MKRLWKAFFTNLGVFDHLVFTAGDSLQLHELAETDLKQARRAFEPRDSSALATVTHGSPQIRKRSQRFKSPAAQPPEAAVGEKMKQANHWRR